MDASISEGAFSAWVEDPLLVATVMLAFAASAILVWYLVRRPALVGRTKLILLAGIAVLPIGAAVTGNVHGYEVTQERAFCSSCHVMLPYTDDSHDLESLTLPSRHARNDLFGHRNCYTCHSDYGLYGTIVTKMTGMKHLYLYYTQYQGVSVEAALERIHLYQPFKNATCIRCHSTKTELWQKVRDHRGADEDVRSGKVSCMGEGCHGPAHPFSKPQVSSSPLAEPVEPLPPFSGGEVR